MECDTKEVAVAESPKPKLYSYWRSSCSQRVRIALNLKGLDYEYKAVNLLKGEQFDPEFEKLNPVKLVPVLVDGDEVIGDSFAILLYLEEKYPEHPLLPKDLKKKALNLQFEKLNPMKCVPTLVDGDLVVGDSYAIILYLEEKYPQHPLLPKDLKKKALNLKVASIVCSSIQPLHYFSSPNFMESKIDDVEKLKWTQNQICKMFTALEKLLKGVAGKCATGDEVLLADVFLAPQIHSGVTRFKINMSPFPTLSRVHATYNELPEFQAALPERQPDCS